jgi:hypothetical protein
MQIDVDTMKAAAAKAILDSLGPEGKAVILENAVKYLLEDEPTRTGIYGTPKKSRIQAMFDEQAGIVLRNIIFEELRDNAEFKDRVTALVKQTMDKMFGEDALASKLSELVTEAISRLTVERKY